MPRTYTWNAYESELQGPLPAGATSIALVSTVGLEAPGYLVIDPDVTNPSVREWIFFETINNNVLENVSRGLPGSVGPLGQGSDHEPNGRVRAIFTKQNLDDIWDGIEDNIGALGQHIGDILDPHSAAGYIKLTTADSRYVNVTGDVMQGILSFDGFALTNLPDPTNLQDPVTLAYFDDNRVIDHDDLANVTTSQHHVRYDDAEAVSAMGPKNDNNDLNHDRYTDNEARTAVDNGTYLKLTGGSVSGDTTFNAVVRLRDIRARSNDLTFQSVSGTQLLAWDDSVDEWEFKKNVDMESHLLISPGNPTSSAHVGDRGYNDGRYLRLSGGSLTGALTIKAGTDSNSSLRISGQGTNDGMWGGSEETSFGFQGSRNLSVFSNSAGQPANVALKGTTLVPLQIIRAGSYGEDAVMMRMTAGGQSEVTVSLGAFRWLEANHGGS